MNLCSNRTGVCATHTPLNAINTKQCQQLTELISKISEAACNEFSTHEIALSVIKFVLTSEAQKGCYEQA